MSRPVSHRARTRTSFLLAVVLTTLVVTFNPTSTGARLRSMLGFGQDLTFTITDSGEADGYTFAATQPGSEQPVTWDSCAEIRYVVNPDGAPADQQQLVSDAVADIEAASGLRFRYDGTTTDRGFRDRAGLLGAAAPVLIGWATPDEVADLADRAGGKDLQRAVIEHELGHVVGLGHVDDRGELMYPETTAATELVRATARASRSSGRARAADVRPPYGLAPGPSRHGRHLPEVSR